MTGEDKGAPLVPQFIRALRFANTLEEVEAVLKSYGKQLEALPEGEEKANLRKLVSRRRTELRGRK